MSNVIYLICYFCTAIYFVVIGSIMLTSKSCLSVNEVDRAAKRHMNRTVGAYMFCWSLQVLIYLPSIFQYGYEQSNTFGYDLCYLINIAINVPMTFMVMHAMLQHRINMWCWLPPLTIPSLLFIVWYIIDPMHQPYPLYVASAFVVLSMAFLLVYYASEYKHFVYRIKAEYSDTTDRGIGWTWYCFAGFAIQTLLFAIYQFYFTLTIEYIYILFSVVNTGLLSYFTLHQKVLSNTDSVEEMEQIIEDEEPKADEGETAPEEKAFYAVIEQKLQRVCQQEMLFLEPDLTRDALSHHLGINRTYLSLYLRSRGTTYYQYINSLRIAYAVRLWRETPDISIVELCRRSGFSSQPTFRKVFKEFVGCLPSEFKEQHIAQSSFSGQQ